MVQKNQKKYKNMQKNNSKTWEASRLLNIKSTEEAKIQTVSGEGCFGALRVDKASKAKPSLNQSEIVLEFNELDFKRPQDFNEIKNCKASFKQNKLLMYSFFKNHKSQVIDRFINFLTRKGKKSKAEIIFFNSIHLLLKLAKLDAKDVLAPGASMHPRSLQNLSLVKIKGHEVSPGPEKLSLNNPFLEIRDPDEALPPRHSAWRQDSTKLKESLGSQGSPDRHMDRSSDTTDQATLDLPTMKSPYHQDIINIFEKAILNLQPFFEVKKVRIAGNTYQVPANLSKKRKEKKAMNWLIESAKEKKKKNTSKNFENCLALEIYDAFLKQGTARQKRNDLHKLAEANRAFSHFRWW